MLREKVSALRKRWDDVTQSTEKQKDSLKSACAKLQAIDVGVRDIATMLAGIDVVALKVEFSELDKGMLDEKIKVYKVCTIVVFSTTLCQELFPISTILLNKIVKIL